MPRKTKAQLAAEAAEAAALAEAEEPEELDALLQAGYDASEEDDEDWSLTEDELADLESAEEAGDYEAFKAIVNLDLVKVTPKTGTDSGNRYLNVEWVVVDGPHEKAHIWDIIMLQGKGLGFAKKKLNQLGLSPSGLNPKAFSALGTIKAQTKIDRAKKDSGYDDKTVIAKYLGAADTAVEADDLPG